MKISITFRDGPRTDETLEFTHPRVRLGSSLENEVGVGGVQAKEVEPVHAEITFECSFFVLYDSGGSRGTYLNGQRVSLAKLKSGDIIQLGREGPSFLFEGDAGFGGHLDLLKTSCRVNARMIQAIVQDSLRQARSRDRGTAVAFVQEVMRRSRWQLGARVAVGLLVVLLATGAGLWKLLSSERAEKAALRTQIQLVEEEFRRREKELDRSNRAFVLSAQARERALRHRIESITRELREERTLSQTAEDALREQVRLLTKELNQTRNEILADRSGRFIGVARENQRGVVWIFHQWALISKKTGKPLVILGRDAEGRPRIEEAPAGPGATLMTQVVSGSGFVANAKGWILTNRHVARPWEFTPGLEKAEITGSTIRLFVVFSDTEKELPARVLRVSDRADLAALAIPPFPGMPYLKRLTPSPEAARQGASIAVIGFPSNAMIDGLARTTLTTGVLSKSSLKDRLQFDASINPGNSGGPILNVRGEVIGVVEATGAAQSGERLHGINYGIPIGLAMELMKELPSS